MRNSKTNSRRALKALLTGALVFCAAIAANAQAVSTTYKGAKDDPFKRYKPSLKRKVEKKVPTPVSVPDINVRIANYKAQKQAAMNLQQPAPKPTTALTLAEVQVTGIFRTPRGYAAMVEATPISLSYVVYPGEQFYDGMLVAIEESRLVFRRQTRWTDGRVEVAVDTKPLRQHSVSDSLTVPKATAANGETPAANKADVNALVEALKALAASAQSQNQSPAQSGQEAQSGQGSAKP